MTKTSTIIVAATLVALLSSPSWALDNSRTEQQVLAATEQEGRKHIVTPTTMDPDIGGQIRKGLLRLSNVEVRGLTGSIFLTMRFGDGYISTKITAPWPSSNKLHKFTDTYTFTVFNSYPTRQQKKLVIEVADDGIISNSVHGKVDFDPQLTAGTKSWQGSFTIDNLIRPDETVQIKLNYRYEPSRARTATFSDATGPFQTAKRSFKRNEDNAISTFRRSHGAKANRYAYLLIGGLFTDVYPRYFTAATNMLKDDLRLAHVKRSEIDTSGLTAVNARKIVNEIKELSRSSGGKKVIVFAHSKGCVDTVTAVQNHASDIQNLIAYVTMFQGPVYGTPLLSHKGREGVSGFFGSAAHLLQNWLNGHPATLNELSVKTRVQVMRTKGWPSWMHSKTLSVASKRTWQTDSVGQTANRILFRGSGMAIEERCATMNDGMVPRPSAILPGGKVALLDDVDHLIPGYDAIIANHHSSALFYAALRVMLDALP
eukprot:TRINITY_DN66614_c7_g5_i1.p1 TRINITY_DN66614_c7_g5~~TRINITY_DN66614_c7_g5_i1.p1  ORF type:complete len:492 (-),score=234.44 TRINITY_DN66614_c7_g5_i1:818-2272(-)